MTLEFSTKPVALVEAPVFQKRGIEVGVRSNLALRSFDPNEPVFSEKPVIETKSVRLAQISGWRPYGEASLSIGLDKSGHIALSSTYKLGSQPPNFIKADTVQTGLLLRY